jgi:hypothetical protein
MVWNKTQLARNEVVESLLVDEAMQNRWDHHFQANVFNTTFGSDLALQNRPACRVDYYNLREEDFGLFVTSTRSQKGRLASSQLMRTITKAVDNEATNEFKLVLRRQWPTMTVPEARCACDSKGEAGKHDHHNPQSFARWFPPVSRQSCRSGFHQNLAAGIYTWFDEPTILWGVDNTVAVVASLPSGHQCHTTIEAPYLHPQICVDVVLATYITSCGSHRAAACANALET